MTNEHRPAEPGTVDPEVSAIYAEIASERVPASLNETILREASRQTGQGYGFWMSWLRPLAWVGTVGLCLAIVVELSNVPQPAPGTFESLPSVAVDELSDERRDSQKPAAGQVEQKRESTSETFVAPARSNQSLGESMDAPAEVPIQSMPASPAADTSAPTAKARTESDVLQLDDAPILEEAEEMARMRQGSDPVASERAGGNAFAARVAAEDMAVSAICDDDARASLDTWVKCILDLELAGLDTRDEREALLAEHPDAELP